jgi:hypothetical protein
MKKRSLIIAMAALVVLIAIMPAMAFEPKEWTVSSGEKTADATILTGAGYFCQLLIMPDGTNNVTVSIYDNTASSGTEIINTMTFAGNGGAQATPPVWIAVNTGIRVDVTVAGGGTVAYTVLYRPRS